MSESLTPEKLKLIRELIATTKGLDPEAQSLLKELLKVDYIQEKTNFPAAIVQQKQTYLKMCEDVLLTDPKFGKVLARPFQKQSKWDAVTWRGYKGFTPNTQMEMVRKGTDLSGLIMNAPQQEQPGEAPKKRFWNRSKGEGEQLEP